MDGWVPLTLIRGQYQVIGAAPDGDSVRFTPTDPRAWARAGVAARVNATGGAQLRLDGIDAHETHHTPRGGTRRRQPAALGGASADRLLELHGFAGGDPHRWSFGSRDCSTGRWPTLSAVREARRTVLPPLRGRAVVTAKSGTSSLSRPAG